MPPLSVVVVGAGIGGLSAALFLRLEGHNVAVYEQFSALTTAGAGIQIPPNSTRIYQHYGILEQLEEVASEPQAMCLRRYRTGEILTTTPTIPHMRRTFGSPYLVAHRADYQRVLYEVAISAGVHVYFNSMVTNIEVDLPALHVAGNEVKADLVIGADGVGSTVRRFLTCGSQTDPTLKPHRVYHALIPKRRMLSRENPSRLLQSGVTNCWIGPDRHVVGYPIRQGEYYNLAMCHGGPAAFAKWDAVGSLEEMNQVYSDFDDTLKETLALVEDVRAWKLAEMPKLRSWSSGNGKVVLIGDAAHAMLPYLAQGAAQAVEDASALARLLRSVTPQPDIEKAISAFEATRKPRVEPIVSGSRRNGDLWHLPDGEGQRNRDESYSMQHRPLQEPPEMREKIEEQPMKSGSLAHVAFQKWLFTYDVMAETDQVAASM